MRCKLLKLAWLPIAGVLLLPFSAADSHRSADSEQNEDRAIRAFMTRWANAYQNLDAKQLAALERPDVEIVDRFGVVHLPGNRDANEKLWSDSFEMVSKYVVPPMFTIDHIRFLRPDVAVVEVGWQFAVGIPLADGERIPPFSQVDTYILVKTHGIWNVAVHNMQEKKP